MVPTNAESNSQELLLKKVLGLLKCTLAKLNSLINIKNEKNNFFIIFGGLHEGHVKITI